MITPHESFTWPSDQVKVWRYMDLSKYAALLFSQSLFFARVTKLGDPFEGTTTLSDKQFQKMVLEKRLTDERFSSWRGMTDEIVNTMFDQTANTRRQTKESMFVNCWHMADHESAAMWRLYAQSSDAVA